YHLLFINLRYDISLHDALPISSGRAQRIIVLDLSKETHGAASGLGLSDATTRRAFNKIDINKTYPNSLTVGMTESPRIPMVFDRDRKITRLNSSHVSISYAVFC